MIASTAAEMGIAFPAPLVEFYQRLDGAESGSVFPSPDEFDMAFCPMPLQEVLVHWAGQKQLVEIGQFNDLTPRSAAGIRDVWWDTGWIPFATNGGGDYLCVDTAPTTAGQVGQVISHSHETGEHKRLSVSLGDYVRELAAQLKQGQFVYHDRYGLLLASSAQEEVAQQEVVDKPDDVFTGMSEWHYANALEAGEAAFKNKDYALYVAQLARFESRLDKLPASRLAFARKKIAETS